MLQLNFLLSTGYVYFNNNIFAHLLVITGYRRAVRDCQQ